MRNSPAEPEVRAEGGEEVLQVSVQRFPCSPSRGPRPQHSMAHSPREGSRPEQGQSVRRKEEQRRAIVVGPHPLFPIPLCCLPWGHRGVRSEGANFLLGKGVGGGERIYFNFCLCFSLPIYFLLGSKLSSFSPGQVCFAHNAHW